MKVTVCFEDVRVIVPCGDGELLVRELIDKAVTRYKKATGKGSNHWVSVHNVKAISGGGILDPDDQLNDVVDDREQLIAEYEEHGRPGLHHNGGDGASASSTGTASPDIFQTGDLTPVNNIQHRPFSQQNGKTDVIVTSRDLSLGTTLIVRRGSEPALNTLTGNKPVENGTSDLKVGRGRKESHQESDEPRTESGSEDEADISTTSKDKSPLSRLQRDSKRQSLSNNPDMYRWLEAQENQQERLKKPIPAERKGPVGGTGKENVAKSPPKHYDDSILIVLRNDGGPLGIHVIPDIDENGKEIGLILQSIEKGGRIERDGRLRVNDRIIEINGSSLEGVNFDSAQRVFRDAMRTQEVRLRVHKNKDPPPLPKQPPPPLMPKPRSHAPVKPSPLTLPPTKGDSSTPSSPEEISSPTDTPNNNNIGEKTVSVNTIKQPNSPLPPRDKLPIQPGPPLKVASPTKKMPPAVPQRHPSTTLSAPPKEAINTLTNTRKIGRKIPIELQKGALGLGFSICSRDNPTGEKPIYIKNILAKGAAVQDARLKPGDRLLEVNGVEMTGKSQSDAVSLLRSIPEGHVCNLVVSRQEVVDELFRIPRELNDEKPTPVLQPPEKSGDDGTLTNTKNKETIKFEIPLNDTGSAGLGVSVKGKTSTTAEGTKELGIFIKSIMNGGAAFKDGKLQVNDQLLEVNNILLTNMSNVNAMEHLRRAMQSEGPAPGFILLTIARKIGAPSPFPSSETSWDTTDGNQVGVLNHSFNLFKEEQTSSTAIVEPSKGGNSVPSVVDKHEHSSESAEPISKGQSLNKRTPVSEPSGPSQDRSKVVPQRHPAFAINNRAETVIIEDDMYAVPRQKRQPVPRPHSTLGLPHVSPSHSRSSSADDTNHQHQRVSVAESDTPKDELSPTADFEFQREGFGRQSMSEKRKGHIDPRGSEFYQRAKENRDTRGMIVNPRDDVRRMRGGGSMESLLSPPSSHHTNYTPHDPHPIHNKPYSQGHKKDQLSNLKRSSSFEDLHSTENAPNSEDQDLPMWRYARIGRPRACNDSFRAAVDRSYDGPQEHNVMDTLEEESMDSSSLNHTQSNSARSSFSSENNNEDFHSLQRKKKHKEKKTGGILKGFWRLGKGRKSNDDEVRRSRSAERPGNLEIRAREFEQQDRTKVLAQQEQERIREFAAKNQELELLEQQKQQHRLELQKQQELQEQQRKLDLQKQQQEQQRKIEQQRQYQEQYRRDQQKHQLNQQRLMHQNRPMFYDPHSQSGQEDFSRQGEPRGDWTGEGKGQSRADRIQLLRVQHQQQHRQRHGQYPSEEIEEYYERQIQEDERQRLMERDRERQQELAGRLQPPVRSVMERSHSRMSSQDSSELRQYPSVSDTSEFSDSNQRYSPFSHSNYPPHRDRPPSRGQYNDGYYQGRSLSRGSQLQDEWHRPHTDFNNANRQTAFTRLNPQTGPSSYGDPVRAYRDPKYPAVAGRRTVQPIGDPSSAKV